MKDKEFYKTLTAILIVVILFSAMIYSLVH